MKVDVITLHNVKNYGSALQTYATQKTLENLGCEVEIINYYRKDLIEEKLVENRINGSNIFSKNVITRFVGKLFLKPSVEKQCKKFKDFFDGNINLT